MCSVTAACISRALHSLSHQYPADIPGFGILEDAALQCIRLRCAAERNTQQADSYEDYVKNYYGDSLYQYIFKPFAEKVWGIRLHG